MFPLHVNLVSSEKNKDKKSENEPKKVEIARFCLIS